MIRSISSPALTFFDKGSPASGSARGVAAAAAAAAMSSSTSSLALGSEPSSPTLASVSKSGTDSPAGPIPLLKLSSALRFKKKSGIPKDHWKPDGEVQYCCNVDCGKQFSLIERKHHCRRCGEIFCQTCSNEVIKLSESLRPNPLGIDCRVCVSCYKAVVDADLAHCGASTGSRTPDEGYATDNSTISSSFSGQTICDQQPSNNISKPTIMPLDWSWSTF